MAVLKVPDMFNTIQEAIDKWQHGDVVRVTKGIFKENIKLREGVILEGGYKSDFSAQNWVQWPSIIDGNKQGSVVIGADQARLNGFTIRNGKAVNGGGIFLSKSGMTIINNIIEDNSADCNGGGIYITEYPGFARAHPLSDTANLTIKDNIIRKNEASGIRGGQGGGIYVEKSRGGISINDNMIGGNFSEGNKAIAGGGIYVEDTPTIHIEGNEISQNIAEWHGGGAMILEGSGNSSLIKNKIHHNVAYGNLGGGLFLMGATFVSKNIITYNRVETNSDIGQGGGIAVQAYEYKSPILENNFINKNYAHYGGGIWVGGVYRMLLINNSIAYNRRNPDFNAGGGLHSDGGGCILLNNIFWANNDDLMEVKGSFKLIHNNIEDADGYGTLGNISSDPKFISDEDLHITPTSGSINHGSPKGAPKDDIDDQQRSHNTPDIGADEFFDKR